MRQLAVDYIVRLIDRAEPRLIVSYIAEGNTTKYKCPHCHAEISSECVFNTYYCSRCGQALNW